MGSSIGGALLVVVRAAGRVAQGCVGVEELLEPAVGGVSGRGAGVGEARVGVVAPDQRTEGLVEFGVGGAGVDTKHGIRVDLFVDRRPGAS